jgi:nitrogen fixation protein NifU and related proteins
MHSEILLQHFKNPRNVGELKDGAVQVLVENPACGDMMRLSAKWMNGKVEQALFQVRGCTASIAAGSVLTELIRGLTHAELSTLSVQQIETALGGLTNETRHAAHLARDAARELARKS